MSVSSNAFVRPWAVARGAIPWRFSWPKKLLLAGHVLSLDAVAVAVVWQQAAGRALHAVPTGAERAALALAVWCVYLLDRQLDALKLEGAATLRHRLHRRNAGAIWGLVGMGVAGSVGTACLVPRELVGRGVLVAAVTAAYLVAVQRFPRVLARGAKELCVGGVFAAGCVLHVPATAEHLPTVVAAMAGLFALNCLMISSWERRYDLPSGMGVSPMRREAQLRTSETPVPREMLFRAMALGLAFAATVTAFALGYPFHPAVLNCVALGALLLVVLDVAARRKYGTVLRVAADLVLLTPLLLPW